MKFSEILQDLIIDNDLSIQLLSKNTGIDDSVLYDYFHDITPNIKFAIKLANYFNCSLNYLFGIDENPNSYAFKSDYNLSLFSNRYDKLLHEHKITHYKLYKEKHLNYSSHYAWQHGAIPSTSSLIIIAEYFDISIDYLVGRTDKK